MPELTAKERMLLGIARTCIGWGEGADFERKEVMFDEGWCEEVEKYYPVKSPDPEDGTPEDFEAWEKQYDVVWADMSNLLDRLGATDTEGN
jgi:hypothetical protein